MNNKNLTKKLGRIEKELSNKKINTLKKKLETVAFVKGDKNTTLEGIAQELHRIQSQLAGIKDSIKKVVLPNDDPLKIKDDGLSYAAYEQLYEAFTKCQEEIAKLENESKKISIPQNPSSEIVDKVNSIKSLLGAVKEQAQDTNNSLTELYHQHKRAEIRITLSKGYRELQHAKDTIQQAQGLTRVEQKRPLLLEAKERIGVITTSLDRKKLLAAAKDYPREKQMITAFNTAISAAQNELQKAITGHMSSADTKVQREITEIKEHAEREVARILKEEGGDVNALEAHSAHWFHESTREELRKIVEDYIRIDELLINHLSVDRTLRAEFEETLKKLAGLYKFQWRGKKDIKKLEAFFKHVEKKKAPDELSQKKLETFRDLYEDVKRLAYITQEVLVRSNNATDQLQTNMPKKGLFGGLFRRGGSQ